MTINGVTNKVHEAMEVFLFEVGVKSTQGRDVDSHDLRLISLSNFYCLQQ